MTDAENDETMNRELQRTSGLTRQAIVATLAILSCLVLILIGVVIWLVLANQGANARTAEQVTNAQRASDRRWCATMVLLTSVPVQKPTDPTANPSREANYQLYVDFVTLRQEFGCGR